MSNQPENQPATLLREESLRRVTARLRAEMSPFELDDTMRELRTHLTASAAAFEEVGLSPDEAMKAAILKFGEPEAIDEDLTREARKTKHTPAAALAIFWAAMVCAPLMIAADYSMVVTRLVYTNSEGMPAIGLLVGAIVGACLQRRPRTPLVAALRTAILLPTLLELICMGLNRAYPGTPLLVGGFIAFGVAGFFTGLVASWGQGVLIRHYARPKTPPKALS